MRAPLCWPKAHRTGAERQTRKFCGGFFLTIVIPRRSFGQRYFAFKKCREQPSRTHHAAFQSAFFAVANFCGLFVGKPARANQSERLALVCWDEFKQAQRVTKFDNTDLLWTIVRKPLGTDFVPPYLTPRASQVGVVVIAHYDTEPRLQIGSRFIAGARAPRAQERILRQIIGKRPIAGEVAREGTKKRFKLKQICLK